MKTRSTSIALPALLALVALVALLAAAPLAHAHVLTDAERAAPTFGWSFAPWPVALMAASIAAYAAGYLRLRRRSGSRGRVLRARHAAAFAGGSCALALALFSPLDTLSAWLFSAHMVQHETMMLIAAPLLVLGRPLAVWIWALPHEWRLWVGHRIRARGVAASWRFLTAPLTGWWLHAVALWAWHAPAAFEAALVHPFVHSLQHSSFLLTALVFWWTVFGDGARRQSGGHAMLSVFTTMVHTTALGALITLAPGLWYPYYVEPCSTLGIDPLHDQQLGGLIMWVPGAAAYLIGGLAIAARWLSCQSSPQFAPGRAAIVPRDTPR
ncbi:cytochrome c oxidase assembly protein [Paraburkholderia sp. SARCC-3016]|uniref:cytochrome c oxidase assembly protein n=1 Tax=Paraburkholderia sp. SARCC-3016 TaxID=3058611 RepID=UPI0028088067|nr:cytochrome c oxidase assembly protein [Paraburkholderia sp. SARCC-3016]MDQ7978870.1 cytochrome c oxidase assembly protein [Paraburkholderia sp. SARCC-3016]